MAIYAIRDKDGQYLSNTVGTYIWTTTLSTAKLFDTYKKAAEVQTQTYRQHMKLYAEWKKHRKNATYLKKHKNIDFIEKGAPAYKRYRNIGMSYIPEVVEVEFNAKSVRSNKEKCKERLLYWIKWRESDTFGLKVDEIFKNNT